VIVGDVNAQRLAQARRFGCETVDLSQTDDLRGALAQLVGGAGEVDEPAKVGALSIRIGLGWAKSLSLTTGQCPVMRYNRQLMQAILHDKVQIANNVNATVLPLEQAPQGYQDFDRGAAKKFVLDPHGLVPA